MDERWSVNTKCPKCGTSYADSLESTSAVSQGPAVRYVSPPPPGGLTDVTEHLRVTCLFCGFVRDMPCADAPRPEPPAPESAPKPAARTSEDLEGKSGPGKGPAPEPPGVNETPATGAFEHDPNVKTMDVPMGQGGEHMGPERKKK